MRESGVQRRASTVAANGHRNQLRAGAVYHSRTVASSDKYDRQRRWPAAMNTSDDFILQPECPLAALSPSKSCESVHPGEPRLHLYTLKAVSHFRQSVFWPALIVFCSGIGGYPCRAADGKEIVERATEALKSDWAADPLYAYTEKDEVQKGDKVTSKSFEVVMIDGSDYRFPLAIDGQPLPPARRKTELLKFQDEVERRSSQSPSARQSRIAAWKKQRDENGELLLDFPYALSFQLLGEEMKDGHPSYVFSGTPKPGIVPTTRAAKVLTGIEGKAWVERDTLHPIHVECTVIRPVPVYGALASVLPGTDIEIGMTKVADSVWLIDLVSMRLKVAKIRVFKSLSVTRYTYTRYCPNDSAVQELLSDAGRE